MRLFKRLVSPLLCSLAFFITPLASAASTNQNCPVDDRDKEYKCIEYNSNSASLLLDLYLPSGYQPSDQRPVGLLIHGGGWVEGSRNDMQVTAQWLASKGMVAATVDYRLAPTAKWPAQGIDLIQAVWWLRNNAARYGINPNKVAAIGVSAGGQLAAMLGLTNFTDPGLTHVSSQVQAIVSVFGPWDLRTLNQTEYQRSIVSALLPADGNGQPVGAADASPQLLITQAAPPTLFFHGTADPIIPYQQSFDACNAFKTANAFYANLVKLQDVGHTGPSNMELIYGPLETFLTDWYLGNLTGLNNSDATKVTPGCPSLP